MHRGAGDRGAAKRPRSESGFGGGGGGRGSFGGRGGGFSRGGSAPFRGGGRGGRDDEDHSGGRRGFSRGRGSGGSFRGGSSRGRGFVEERGRDFDRSGSGFGFRGRGRDGPRANPFSGGYRPQVSQEGGKPETAPVQLLKGRDVIVVLEKAGLLLGNLGLVDAYDRSASTELTNASLEGVRPDIVHQCLLALFDSDLAYHRRLRVYISLFARSKKVIEVSPALRPPRTYARFRGLMSALLREGSVSSVDGKVLMRVMPGSIAPVIPDGAEVIGLSNQLQAPVTTALTLARQAAKAPVPDTLQGGVKNISAIYCVSCTDDANLDGVEYITKTVCLNAYPTTAHVLCSRVCEGHFEVLNEKSKDAAK